MFMLDHEQQQLLVALLNEINRFTYEHRSSSLSSSSSVSRRWSKPPTPIAGLEHSSSARQQLIDSIVNIYYHFKDYFRYSFHLELNASSVTWKADHKPKTVSGWLARFFHHDLLSNFNYDQLFDLSDDDEDDDENAEDEGNNNNKDEQQQQENKPKSNGFGDQHRNKADNSLYSPEPGYEARSVTANGHYPTPDNTSSSLTVEQQQTLLSDIIFVLLLFLSLLHKFRYLFPTLVAALEHFWKYFPVIDQTIDKNFLYENYIQLLCTEMGEQRRLNDERVDNLRQEVAQLEKIAKNFDSKLMAEMTQSLVSNPYAYNPYANNAALGNVGVHHGGQSGNTGGGGGGGGHHNNKKSQQHHGLHSNSMLGGETSSSSATSSNAGDRSRGIPCPICNKVFRNSYKLNRHQYVHKDASEKPLVCSWEGCTYRSISNNDLNRHRMIHTGEKPYLCNINGCDKRYSRPDKLRNHRNSVHFKEHHAQGRQKSFVCVASGCNFHCPTRVELNNHMLTHSVFRCEQFACGKQFDKADKLRQHMTKEHHLPSGTPVQPTATGGGNSSNNNANNNAAAVAQQNSVAMQNFAAATSHHHHHARQFSSGEYAAAMAAIGSLPSSLAAAASSHDLASVISSTIAHNAQLANIQPTIHSMLSDPSQLMSSSDFHHQLAGSLLAAAAGNNGGNGVGHCNGPQGAMDLQSGLQQQQQGQQQQGQQQQRLNGIPVWSS